MKERVFIMKLINQNLPPSVKIFKNFMKKFEETGSVEVNRRW